MITRTASRSVALALAIVLVAMAPGVPAWAAAAGTITGPVATGFGGVNVAAIVPLAGANTLNAAPLSMPLTVLQPSSGVSQWNAAPTPRYVTPTLVRHAAGSHDAVPPSLVNQAPTEDSTQSPESLSRSTLFDGSNRQVLFQQESGAPTPSPEPSTPRPTLKPAAPKSTGHVPFVAPLEIVGKLQKLAVSNPAAALAAASDTLLNEGPSAPEVKLGAMNVLNTLEKSMPAEVMSVYLAVLSLGARSDIQAAKERNIDPWYYVQRAAANRVTWAASSSRASVPSSALAVLTAANKDKNVNVRLAAGEAMRALGAEPAAEPVEIADDEPVATPYSVTRAEDDQAAATAKAIETGKKKIVRNIKIGVVVAALLASMIGTETYFAYKNSANSPLNQAVAEQTVKRLPLSDADMPLEQAAPQAAPVQSPEAQAAQIAAAKLQLQQQQDREFKADSVQNLKGINDSMAMMAKAQQDMAKPKGIMESFGYTLITTLLSIVLLAYLFKRLGFMGGAAAGADKKDSKKAVKPTTRFTDVAGIDESLVEIREVLEVLLHPKRFQRLGAKIPRGVLMEGPPGTGKTLLAQAMAGEADAHIIVRSGPQFVEKFVGVGASRVRSMFAEAEELAKTGRPVIIFIDEIDALGKKRGNGESGGGNDEREQTLNQLLTEMQGFDSTKGILILAATNRADMLDEALLRPGRFDRKIHVGVPETLGREAILALHARTVRLDPKVDLKRTAQRTTGKSGAYLAGVVNEAAMLAYRRGGESLSVEDFEEAVDRIVVGAKRVLLMSDEEKYATAAHEVGHILANILNENPKLRVPVGKVTILPHGGALGFAETNEGDKYSYKQSELEAVIDRMLGGYIAEEIYIGETSTGPGNDLERANAIVLDMVQKWGMSKKLGLVSTAPKNGDPLQRGPYGDKVSDMVHSEVSRMLEESKTRVRARLLANRDKHEAMIQALLLKETLSAEEIEAIAHPEASRTQP